MTGALRIGTRGSPLARAQTELVCRALGAVQPELALEVVAIRTTGDRVVERWSKFHRTDKPCKSANHRSRFTYSDEVLDDLPFPIDDIDGNRYRLCDYCFFGGPASTIAKL